MNLRTTVSIIRMYLKSPDTARPSHYREAWWEPESKDFIIHHGKVGEIGSTEGETVTDPHEVDTLLASFEEQNRQDGFLDIEDISHESFTVVIKQKGNASSAVEETNAEKFLASYTALLAWRGLGTVEEWNSQPGEGRFVFHVSTVHRNKAAKLAAEALKKTDFRADRMSVERN